MLYFYRPPSEDCSEEVEDEARRARAVARREVLSQLQQLECQLTAIESTARTVEGELLASNQVEGVAREDDWEPCWGDYVLGSAAFYTQCTVDTYTICACMRVNHIDWLGEFVSVDFLRTLAGI